MMGSWKRRLIGAIALGIAIVLGSSLAATSLRADSKWSWEGVIVGGILGGLIGSAHDGRPDHVAAITVTTGLAPFYDGPFIVHRHHGGWHRHPWKHRRGWHVWLGPQDPWYVHTDRYHHRQWRGPRVQLRSQPAHPTRHQHPQAHGQRAHQQPQHVQVQTHQHRHGQQVHRQTRQTNPHVYRHGHAHRW